jgi:two-component system, chemotaxis family, chemotaxis protein CheY
MHTILIVDDSQFVRDYHSYILEEASFEVVTAIDGADGLEKLFLSRCDLILTDINMKGMDGYEFIGKVRAEQEFEDVPIIILSTEGEDKDRIKGFQLGANLYLTKPCAPAQMIENIRMILAAS